MPIDTERVLIKSLGKALRILDLFTFRRPEWGVTEISRELGIQKTVAYNLAETLAAGGLLEKDSRSHRYRVGALSYRLGLLFADKDDFVKRARSVLEMIRDRTGHTVQLGIIDHGDLLILVAADASTRIRVVAGEGEHRSAYASAAGRAILSALPEPIARSLLPRELKPHTAHTETDKNKLMGLIREATACGYAVQRDELVDNVTAVGVPVVSSSGRVVAAISTSFLTTADDDAEVQALAGLLRGAAMDMADAASETLADMGDNPIIMSKLNDLIA